MPTYERDRFDSPAPVAHVRFASMTGGNSVDDVPLLIDTGADVTLLPIEMTRFVVDAAAATREYELEGFDGTRSSAAAVELEMHFLGKVFRGQFLLVDQPWGVLGRNILNHLSIVLDGPKRSWSESIQ